jgi:hypothetical protein
MNVKCKSGCGNVKCESGCGNVKCETDECRM